MITIEISRYRNGWKCFEAPNGRTRVPKSRARNRLPHWPRLLSLWQDSRSRFERPSLPIHDCRISIYRITLAFAARPRVETEPMQPCSFRRRAGCVSVLLLVLSLRTVSGNSAAWNINPPTNDWNTKTNRTPNTVPNSPEDVATFDLTAMTLPIIHSDIELDTLFFTANALP